MAESLSTRARRLSPAAVLLVAAALAFRSLDDSDTWWHLASGRWIAANWRVPATDPFSHTVPDHAWINLQWLYDLVLYVLYSVGGATLLVLTATAAYTGAIDTGGPLAVVDYLERYVHAPATYDDYLELFGGERLAQQRARARELTT